jgi:hypothetical protein
MLSAIYTDSLHATQSPELKSYHQHRTALVTKNLIIFQLATFLTAMM